MVPAASDKNTATEPSINTDHPQLVEHSSRLRHTYVFIGKFTTKHDAYHHTLTLFLSFVSCIFWSFSSGNQRHKEVGSRRQQKNHSFFNVTRTPTWANWKVQTTRTEKPWSAPYNWCKPIAKESIGKVEHICKMRVPRRNTLHNSS